MIVTKNINIVDNGDADYLKGLQTVSRHKVLALQVTTGLLRFREREEGQNQIRWWTEKAKYKNTKIQKPQKKRSRKREEGHNQIKITSSFTNN